MSQKEEKEAVFSSKGALLRNHILTWMDVSNVYACLCSLYCCRFSTQRMMDYRASRTPSVMSAFTVMLRSGPTTICRDTSSFTPVRIIVTMLTTSGRRADVVYRSNPRREAVSLQSVRYAIHSEIPSPAA